MMKKMIIFDPAMCCSTGICGPGVNPELLRVATVISNLKSNGIFVERHNLSSNPQAFINNQVINGLLNQYSVSILPITMVDGVVVKTNGYPTNEEFCFLLDVPEAYLNIKINRKSKGARCGCKDGCC